MLTNSTENNKPDKKNNLNDLKKYLIKQLSSDQKNGMPDTSLKVKNDDNRKESFDKMLKY